MVWCGVVWCGVVWCGVVWCGVVWCGVVWCVFLCIFLFFLSILFFLILALSLSFFSLLSSLLFSLLFSPPNNVERTDQPTRRPTSRLLNLIWRTASAQQSVLSLLLSPPSSLPSPSHRLKKEGTFYYRNISGEGIILNYSFKLIQKNRRRVKLQASLLHINSKSIDLQRVKTVIIFGKMVCFPHQSRTYVRKRCQGHVRCVTVVDAGLKTHIGLS